VAPDVIITEKQLSR